MKSLVRLAHVILQDAGMMCGTDTQRDYQTVVSRVEDEGLSFLTITLPDFCKAFERALEEKGVGNVMFPGFAKARKSRRGVGSHARIPSFLRGIVCQVFDEETGLLLDEPSVTAIFAVRQVCLFFKKIELPCSHKRVRAAYKNFIKIEQEMPGEESVNERMKLLATDVFNHIFARVMGGMRVKSLNYSLIPKHGPGATAERISGNRKYEFLSWPERLNQSFPIDQFGVSNPYWLLDTELVNQIDWLSPEQESPVRVITVPKTMKSPRIIAIEPVCMQYAQQGVAISLTTEIESDKLLGGQINFSDQLVNRRKALESSKNGRYATIDLSEASDRVPLWLVEQLFRKDRVGHTSDENSVVWDIIYACRSARANLPRTSGLTMPLELKKFASMGSALCFPVEAMVFYTLALCGVIQHAQQADISQVNFVWKYYKKYAREVFVYGDDIIVPVDAVQTVRTWLETFGLKVNEAKTFSKGNFRESCGMDAFGGHDVTPCYLRRKPPTNWHDANEIVSYVSLANQLYEKGLWLSAAHVRREVEDLLGPLPFRS